MLNKVRHRKKFSNKKLKNKDGENQEKIQGNGQKWGKWIKMDKNGEKVPVKLGKWTKIG